MGYKWDINYKWDVMIYSRNINVFFSVKIPSGVIKRGIDWKIAHLQNESPMKGYLVVHPTDPKWVSSPQLFTWIKPTHIPVF